MTPEARARAFADRIAEELRKEIVLANNDEVERRREVERELKGLRDVAEQVNCKVNSLMVPKAVGEMAEESYAKAFPEPDYRDLVSQLRRIAGPDHHVGLLFFSKANPKFACEVRQNEYGDFRCDGSSDISMEDAIQKCIDRWNREIVA